METPFPPSSKFSPGEGPVFIWKKFFESLWVQGDTQGYGQVTKEAFGTRECRTSGGDFCCSWEGREERKEQKEVREKPGYGRDLEGAPNSWKV